MGELNIEDLHKGMDLVNADIAVPPGFTRESVGVDFQYAGKIQPLCKDLLIRDYAPYTVVDAAIVYLDDVKYEFVTTSNGLYVTTGSTTTLINSGFKTTFKAIPINDAWVFIAGTAACIKWKPSYGAVTYAVGLNTPPKPTLAAGAQSTKDIDEMDATTGWSATGGGTGGAIALDNVRYKSGTGSIKFTCDTSQKLIVTKSVTLDLSKFSIAGDLGQAFISFWYYAEDLTKVKDIKVQFSCAADGGFGVDFYHAKIEMDGTSSGTITYGQALAAAQAEAMTSNPNLSDINVDGQWIRITYDPSTKVFSYYQMLVDQSGGLMWGADLTYNQLPLSLTKRTDSTGTGQWTRVRFAVTEFVRNGDTSGRDWSTITAVKLTLSASAAGQAVVNFDKLRLVGGGNLWGNYYVAVAYQNGLGNYGPYSDWAGPVSLEGQTLGISGLTVDADAQTTKRRLAILGGSVTVPMVSYINDNTSTSYTYNTADSALVTEETHFYNRPPTGCKDAIEFDGRIWMVGVPGYKDRLVYSEPLYYEAFPLRNYMIIQEGERLHQVTSMGEHVVARGANKEHIIYLLTTDPKTWKPRDGAREGAVSSRCLIKLASNIHIYVGKTGFYMSGGTQGGDREFLHGISQVATNYNNVIGAHAGEMAYLGFTDTGSTARVLRIDFRNGIDKPIAHYVENLAVTTIYADQTTKTIYYGYGTAVYQFQGDATHYMATSLQLPGQFAGTPHKKDWSFVSCDVETGTLAMAIYPDRNLSSGLSVTIPAGLNEPVSLPPAICRTLGVKFTSADNVFYTLRLPIQFLYSEVCQ